MENSGAYIGVQLVTKISKILKAIEDLVISIVCSIFDCANKAGFCFDTTEGLNPPRVSWSSSALDFLLSTNDLATESLEAAPLNDNFDTLDFAGFIVDFSLKGAIDESENFYLKW